MLKDLILKNRTYRRFYEEYEISKEELLSLIDLARLSSTGRNIQALRYIIADTPEIKEKVFKNIRWAGYFKDWEGPLVGERPSAYLVMLLDQELTKFCYWDHGIAAQSILLGAVERELGGCMFGAVDKENLRVDLKISKRYEIMMVIAIGKPKEIVVLDDISEDGDIKYWRDENQIHHVPKRRLEDLILDIE
ncbi:MAG: nitroreductase family protein [Clostridiales bacterium]|nr:nitroreductase family protein [Clostridiales bacterium]